MVGPLMLLKLLHCKKRCQRNSRKKHNFYPSTSDTASTNTGAQDSGSKQEVEDSQTSCRVCLKNGDIPIYRKDGDDSIAEALSTFGGIEIDVGDAYPKYLCHSCHALLQGAILFRKTAQESNQILNKPPEIKPEISNDIDDANDYNSFDYDVTEEAGDTQEAESRSYHCKRCDMDFENFTQYSEHRLSEEHENRRLVCPICHNTYTVLYYKKHLALHNKSKSPYMCDICGKNFIVQGQFTRHRLTHFYELPFKCSLCPYRGRFSESLKMHMRTHTGEKPYQCSQCAARFVNKSNLNKHMFTHKGEYDYKCNTCGRGFYTQRSLDLHIKVDHTGVKDHVCNICSKPFGYRKQMMKHQLKVHKRQKLKTGRLPLYLQVDKIGN